jgi:undecaprenyl-diphosphatase
VALLALLLATVLTGSVAGAQADGEAPDPPPDTTATAEAGAEDPDDELTPAKAALLGVIEGITEYLPVSSTGHLLVAQEAIGVGDTPETEDAANTYAIAIQAGAILAVLLLYSRRIGTMFQGLAGRSDEGQRVLVGLALACIPAGLTALAFEDTIKDQLLGPWPIVAAWAVGGVVILVVEPRLRRREGKTPLEAITARQALIIGVVQILALWPGTSRSLTTILAGLAVGLTLAAAVEFSFLVGLATLGVATTYEFVANGGELFDTYGVVDPLIGLAVSFVAAALAVRWLVTYLQRHSLAIFGWYRLALAAVVGTLVFTGAI